MRPNLRHLVIAISLLIGLTTYSQINRGEISDTIQPKHLLLNEVSVNAPFSIWALKQWSGSISIIDSLSLENGNSYQIANQLNAIPGVFMQEGTLSTSRITIRGIGSRTPYNSNRIKVYWGDIPMTDGDGVSSIEDIGFNDINNIVVLKGPASALYGAGLGGVIVINPWELNNNSYHLNLKSEVAAYGTFSNQISILLSAKRGKTWLTAGQLKTDGYRDNSAYKRYNITLKGKYRLGKHHMHYLYNFRHFNGQIPSSLDSTDFHNEPSKAADSWAAICGYENSNRHIFNIALSSALNQNLTHSINLFSIITNLDELRPFNQLDETKLAIGIRDKLSYQFEKIKMEGGIEVMFEKNKLTLLGVKEHNKGTPLSKNTIERTYINTFGLAHYFLTPELSIQGGFNVNLTQYNNTDEFNDLKTSHQYPIVFSPRIGANYQLYKHSNIYMAAGHGFSPPSVEEAQLPSGGFNDEIKPEEGYHVDFGYRFSSSSGNTNAELTAYWMQMKNLLVTKRESEAVFYGVNAGKTDHKGIETSINHRLLWHANSLTLSGTFAYSINKFNEFIDDGIDFSGNHLPGIPQYSLFTQATYQAAGNTLILNYRQYGEQFLNDSNNKSYTPFGVLNAKVSRKLKWKSLAANIYLGANNLLNTHYASMLLINAPSFGNNQPRYYYPALPFNLYGGFSITL
ncbi:TonB-dependent receptor [Carboxylicivirga marina]|uniref:TonB-dependent receptor n=1 Tax=Carboxylicivirga marina TaxID=2800988 RepID=A0ABS1HIN4_9BACT|nr:TonB-dependent receptor [Carboxylicivirga marina]MBK3517069.1 TonB-dependent receptor [Carboxylicivirga marina]